MSEALKKIDEFRANLLRELLSRCTEPQIEIFNKMYGSIDHIIEGRHPNDKVQLTRKETNDKVEWAIQQCERTLNKVKV